LRRPARKSGVVDWIHRKGRECDEWTGEIERLLEMEVDEAVYDEENSEAKPPSVGNGNPNEGDDDHQEIRAVEIIDEPEKEIEVFIAELSNPK